MSQLEWDGRHLEGDCLALTILTGVSAADDAPTLITVAASTGACRYLIRPGQVGEFLLEHREALFVCHDVGPLFWAIADLLNRYPDRDALEVLWRLPRTGRLHDVILTRQQRC